MDRITRALHTQIDTSDAASVVTPIYQASAFESHSPYFYTRKDNPNVREFELTVATLEGAKYGIAFNTGMAAIKAVMDLVPPRGKVIVNKHIYGCTLQLLFRLEKQKRILLDILDLSNPDNYEKITDDIDLIFFETPTNPFLNTITIKEVRARVHNSKTMIVVDNTWATPLYQHPLECGADISLHSATKFMSGHSDVMGGIILTNDDTLEYKLKEDRFYSGSILTPYSAWLLRRSLQTLELRLTSHCTTTREMKDWLSTLPEIKKVYYPKMGNNQLANYGGILFFQFSDEYFDCYTMFRDALTLFDSGTGMAAVTSMVAQPYTGSHASLDEVKKAEMGLDKGLVRLCFGLESQDSLKTDIFRAIEIINSTLSEDSSIVMSNSVNNKRLI